MVIELAKFNQIRKSLKVQGKKLVFTNGCFDIIHRGHVEYLQAAKNLGDVLVVGLNSDSSVRRLKGKNRPINSQEDRAVVIDGLKSVDYVIIFNEDTPAQLIGEINPNVLVKGGDYKIDEIVGRETVWQNGGEVKIIPLVKGRSTKGIIEKILDTYQIERLIFSP